MTAPEEVAQRMLGEAILLAATRRSLAGELRALGIEPSPADVMAYAAMSPRDRRLANTQYLATLAETGIFGSLDGVLENPANPDSPDGGN
jgi:hypothetical protein